MRVLGIASEAMLRANASQVAADAPKGGTTYDSHLRVDGAESFAGGPASSSHDGGGR